MTEFHSMLHEGTVYFSNRGDAERHQRTAPETTEVQAAPDMWRRRGYPFVVRPKGSDTEPVERYTVDAGRLILRDGVPYITIHRENATPVSADEVTRFIADTLNKKHWKGEVRS